MPLFEGGPAWSDAITSLFVQWIFGLLILVGGAGQVQHIEHKKVDFPSNT